MNTHPPSVLEKIKAYKLDEIIAAKDALPEADLLAQAKATPTPRDFAGTLIEAQKTQYALIAEIKKASPSKGIIRADFDPAALAQAYAEGGAHCLSVLTDTPSFQGAPEFLRQARTVCDLPLLRKDFLYDTYQVLEARAWGADCILIIMASVDDALARDLEQAAQEMGLSVLIESHNQAELERALRLQSPLIGVNNRDLNTFHTDLATTETLAKMVPEDRILISESGLFTHADLTRMASCGARTFLIGESLMRQPHVADATRTLLQGDAQ